MELISVHVPKTAGVTFRTLLQTNYGLSAVSLDYGDRALDPLSTFQTDPARWRVEADHHAALLPSSVQVVHGHFGGAKYDPTFPATPKIVWLREPVSRLVSHYHYWRTLPPTPHSLHRRLLDEKLSLLEFARLPSMQNVLANVFLRDCCLADFAFVGIQEHFAADLFTLGKFLHWPLEFPVGRENTNQQVGYQGTRLTDSEHAELASLNTDDIALYQRALALRASRIAV